MYNISTKIIYVLDVENERRTVMENYVSAELNVVALAAADTISSSVQITPDENELPVDTITRV